MLVDTAIGFLLHQLGEIIGRERVTQVEALRQVTFPLAQTSQLFLGLHALGCDLEAKVVSQPDRGFSDLRGLRVSGYVPDEGSVDLENLDREALQILDPGVFMSA